MDDLFERGEFDHLDSLEEVRKAASRRLEEHNQTPRDELGGLTPEQAFRLFYSEWNSPAGVMRIHEDLMDAEADAVRFVNNGRILLEAAARRDGLPATRSGNLKRSVVADFLESMQFDPHTVQSIRDVNKVINEGDVRPLNVLRVVLEVGDFLEQKEGRFVPSERGDRFLEAWGGGKRLQQLFITYFRKFNLAYFTRGREWPEIQNTVPFAFYRLSQLEDGWHDREDLIDRITLPSIREQAEQYDHNFLGMHYAQRVLEPLTKFHLLERCRVGDGRRHEKDVQYRKHGLMDRFLEFRF